MMLTMETLTAWLQRYFDAWVSNDPADVAGLFAEDAVYYYGPFTEPARGRETIVANWVADPEQQVDITYRFEALAVRGNLGVAHWRVTFTPAAGRGPRRELDGILALRFDAALACTEHREWFAARELT